MNLISSKIGIKALDKNYEETINYHNNGIKFHSKLTICTSTAYFLYIM